LIEEQGTPIDPAVQRD